MKTEPPSQEPIPPNAAPQGQWDRATLDQAADFARGYFELGMLDEAEAPLKLPADAPDAWKSYMKVGLAKILWARGDLESFVRHCYHWRLTRALPPDWYSMMSTALISLGRIEDAVALTRQGMNSNDASPGDYYNLRCFHANAGQYRNAVEALSKGSPWNNLGQFKALVDSDLQPLWYRLPGFMAGPSEWSPESRAFLANLAQCPMEHPTQSVWNPPDRHKLSPEFGQRLVYSGKQRLFIMDPQNQFKQWALNRARAAQRLIRRVVNLSGWLQG